MLAALGLVMVWWMAPVAVPLGSHASLRWTAGEAAQGCITAAALAEAVDHRVDPAGAPAAFVIDGRIGPRADGGGWTATVRTLDAAGRLLGERDVQAAGPDCHALDATLVLVIGLILDREPAPVAATPLGAPRATRSWRVDASLGGLVAGGLLPGPALGAGLTIELAAPHVWPLELAGTLWRHGDATASDGGVRVALATGGLATCPLIPGVRWLAACVGAQAGALRAHGLGFTQNDHATDVIVDVTAEVRGEWRLTSRLALRVGAGLWVPLTRPRLVAQTGVAELVYQPAAVAAVGRIALAGRF